jgi:hypothetical protein
MKNLDTWMSMSLVVTIYVVENLAGPPSQPSGAVATLRGDNKDTATKITTNSHGSRA